MPQPQLIIITGPVKAPLFILFYFYFHVYFFLSSRKNNLMCLCIFVYVPEKCVLLFYALSFLIFIIGARL